MRPQYTKDYKPSWTRITQLKLNTVNGLCVNCTQCAKLTNENRSVPADKLTQCVRQFIILIIKLVSHKN